GRVTARVGMAVQAIGVAGQMHGLVLVDSSGMPVRDAVLWPDQRAVGVLDVFTGFDAGRPGELGNPIAAGMAGPILLWLSRNEPESLGAGTVAVQPKDWLRMQLCDGGALTDPSDASATLLYDVLADGWSDELRKELGLRRDLLPRIVPSDQVAGFLRKDLADELNLPADIPVVVGAGDAPAALLGAGIEEPGRMLINAGTAAQALTPLPSPTIPPADLLGVHQYRSATDMTPWYAMASMVNAGLALSWVRRIVGFEWEQVYRLGDQALNRDDDPLFLPFLSTERDPWADNSRGGVWSGLNLGHDREALARSAVLGVALYLGLRVRRLMALTQEGSVMMAGGATRHLEWVELMATILGRKVAIAPDSHMTVRGAAQLAARGVGKAIPHPQVAHVVEPRLDDDVEGPMSAFEAAVRGDDRAAQEGHTSG
ncbi:MAG: FGGY family carbohydrate kinase, partial [Actinomycetota bacterium]